MKNLASIFTQITFLSQLGLSLIAPLLLCLLFCSWLTGRFELGGWVYLPGFFLGLGGSAMTAYKIYLEIIKQEKKKKRRSGAFYNKH